MCDGITVQTANLLTILETTAANKLCSFNQILTLDLYVNGTIPGGYPISFPILFSKVDLRASIPNVCTQEFGYGGQPVIY